jgi:hypothetical protein
MTHQMEGKSDTKGRGADSVKSGTKAFWDQQWGGAAFAGGFTHEYKKICSITGVIKIISKLIELKQFFQLIGVPGKNDYRRSV